MLQEFCGIGLFIWISKGDFMVFCRLIFSRNTEIYHWETLGDSKQSGFRKVWCKGGGYHDYLSEQLVSQYRKIS